jgi:hypothetical protein
MTNEQLIGTIKRELPSLLRSDPSLRQYIIELTREEYAPRQQTGDRFEGVFAEMQRNHEEWQEYVKSQDAKWEAQKKSWEEYTKKQDAKWEAQEKQTEESWEQIEKLSQETLAIAGRVDRRLGAMGARWGLESEAAFRNALKGILEDTFDVDVLNINDYDESGEVFGRPDQIELDIIIKNGMLLICELKSSIDKAGIYIFERKARFYEKRHNRKANRLIIISPMVDPRAMKVAKRLGIEVYSDALDVESDA